MAVFASEYVPRACYTGIIAGMGKKVSYVGDENKLRRGILNLTGELFNPKVNREEMCPCMLETFNVLPCMFSSWAF